MGNVMGSLQEIIMQILSDYGLFGLFWFCGFLFCCLNTVLFVVLKQNFYLGCPLSSASGIVIHGQTLLGRAALSNCTAHFPLSKNILIVYMLFYFSVKEWLAGKTSKL